MSPSDLSFHYQTLELGVGATLAEVKIAYRRLARRYHPDLNPGDRQAEDRFKQITQAYKALLTLLEATESENVANPTQSASTPVKPTVSVEVVHPNTSTIPVEPLTETEQQLKGRSLRKLRDLLKRKQWRSAIAHIETLTDRLRQEPEIRRAQATAYHRWARDLISRRQYDSARDYLKRALKIDPKNRSLWEEVQRDYQRIERQLRLY